MILERRQIAARGLLGNAPVRLYVGCSHIEARPESCQVPALSCRELALGRLEALADRGHPPERDLGPALDRIALAVEGFETAGNRYWMDMATAERDRIRQRLDAPVAADDG